MLLLAYTPLTPRVSSEHTSLATRAAPDSARDMLSVGAGASSGDAADQ
jgi:hypothetical protein